MIVSLQQLQHLNDHRLELTKNLFTRFHSLETDALNDCQNRLNSFQSSVAAIDPKEDSETFAHYHKVQWVEPYNFAFEPSLLWKDSVCGGGGGGFTFVF